MQLVYSAGGGGFGGGGGGSLIGLAPAGFGGGNGSSTATSGGGGAGFGGAIFVANGAVVIIQGNTTETDGNVLGGNPADATAEPGAQSGAGVFLEGTGTLVFAPATGTKITLSDAISDEIGSALPHPDPNDNSWSLDQNGAGATLLLGNNALGGSVSVENGTLVLSGNIAGGATVSAGGLLIGDAQYGGTVTNNGTFAPSLTRNPYQIAYVGNFKSGNNAVTCFYADAAGHVSAIYADSGAAPNPLGVARINFSGGPPVGASYGLLGMRFYYEGTNTFSSIETNIPGLQGNVQLSGNAMFPHYGGSIIFTVTASDEILSSGFEDRIIKSECDKAFSY